MNEGLLIGMYIFEVCIVFILGVLYILFNMSDIIYIGLFISTAILTSYFASTQICKGSIKWSSLMYATFTPIILVFVLIAALINSPFTKSWLVPFAYTFGPIIYGSFSENEIENQNKVNKYNRISKIIWYFLSALLTLSYSLHSISDLECIPPPIKS